MSSVPVDFLNAVAAQFAAQEARLAALTQKVEALAATQLVGVSLDRGSPDDPRSYVLCLELADGTTARRPVTLALPVHRGKWMPDRSYTLNDEVAWDGHSWRCSRPAVIGPNTEPGTCDAWLLVAKQGRRGPAYVPHHIPNHEARQ